MKLCSIETETTQAVLQSIASKLREIVQDDGHADSNFVTTTSTVSRLLRGVDHKVSTLVGVANELGYDVVVHFRERKVPSAAQILRGWRAELKHSDEEDAA